MGTGGTVVPPLDAFGTRLELEELRAGLDVSGVPALRLEIRDSDLLLEVAGADVGSDEVSRAVTWLRSMFSPLIPVQLEKRERLDEVGTVVVDGRRSLRSVIVLAEVRNPVLELSDALHDLLERLGVERSFAAAQGLPRTLEDSLAENLNEMAARWSECLSEWGVELASPWSHCGMPMSGNSKGSCVGLGKSPCKTATPMLKPTMRLASK